MAKYVKEAEDAITKVAAVSDDENEPIKRPANRITIGIIDAISVVTNKDSFTKKAMRISIKKA